MRYWTVSGQGSSRAEFVIRKALDLLHLLGDTLPLPPSVLAHEGVGQIQVGVVSLVASAVHQGLLGRGQVTRQTPVMGAVTVEAEEAVVRVEAGHEPGVERGREVTSSQRPEAWPRQ